MEGKSATTKKKIPILLGSEMMGGQPRFKEMFKEMKKVKGKGLKGRL